MKTKSLSITSTYQDITVQSVCHKVVVKEDESVANWPTTNLRYRPSSGDPYDELTAGKQIIKECIPGKLFQPGDVIGQVAIASGSTSGIQVEE